MATNSWRIGFLAVMAGLSLVACGGGDEGDSGVTPPPSSPGQVAPNSLPLISGTPSTTVTAGTTYLFQPNATDTDGDLLSFSVTGMPAWASINAQTGMLSGTPAEADVGTTADIVITVSDGRASASLPAFRIAINSAVAPPPPPPPAGNTAPTISGSPPVSVQATTAYSFTPSASDNEGQTLVYSISNRPSWAAFSTSTGRLSGTPSTSQIRTYSNIVISVSDGSLSASLPPFSITVTATPNRAPTVSGTPSTSVTVNTSYTFQPSASDPDGQSLAWTIANKPAWATFSTSSGRLSGTPTSTGTTSNIVISVSDGTLSASLPAFSLTVNAAPNAAPTITGSPPTSVVVGAAYSFTPTASDPNGDTLAFSISNKPTWLVFSTATGALTGTAQAGSYPNIVISVSDGTVTRSLPAFTLTVNQQQATGTANLTWTVPTQNTDGSALTDLAGYRIYRGTSANALNEITQVPGAGSTSYSYSQLASGTHYFAVAAYNNAGVESALSAVGSKTIP